MNELNFNNIEIHSVIGTGADYEVRLAGLTGQDPNLVMKRPNPHSILKNLHLSTEQRTNRMIKFHNDIGNEINGITQIIGHFINTSENTCLYTDDLEFDYTVVCQKRAPGIPLNADVRARILKVPTGLGQSLFSLFPIGLKDRFVIPLKLMEIQTQLYSKGYLLFDLNPQNVFYSPKTNEVNVIDTADLHSLAGNNDIKTANKSPEDYFVELIRYFIASEAIPRTESDYFTPRGDRPYINIDSELSSLKQQFSLLETPDSFRMLSILEKISAKAYHTVSVFHEDISVYFSEAEHKFEQAARDSEIQASWYAAKEHLRHTHWSKYDFNFDHN